MWGRASALLTPTAKPHVGQGFSPADTRGIVSASHDKETHMRRTWALPLLVLLAFARVPSAGRAAESPAAGPLAPLLTNLGTLEHPVTTTNPRAQTFFDQGLRLVYGF